jgi:glutathione synthase/RimK-type ligase-like ATP-grasp enzyme
MKFDRIIIRPYSTECGGARDIVKLLNEMGVPSKRVYSKETSYQPQPGDFIINWGAGYPADWQHLLTEKNVFLNSPISVANSVSKVRSFHNFEKEEIPTPEWTTSQRKAQEWAKEGHTVVIRETDRGYDGAGLKLATKGSEIAWAPLYTKFIPNTKMEFRAYIFKGELIDLLYKYAPLKVKSDFIRTETNGWEYGRKAVPTSHRAVMEGLAAKCIAANGMDFGGVDIIQTDNDEFYALETNSEPGIGKITAQRFANAFRKEAGL